MCRRQLLFLLLLFLVSNASAQIINGLDTLYGNEWIRFDQTYLKIKVGQDGIYRIQQAALANAGVPLAQVSGEQFQLWHNGEQVPLFVSTSGLLGPSDYLDFFGEKNTSELDRYLFRNPDSMMINPRYSLVTDTAAYFLTWSNAAGNPRYQPIPNDLSNLPPKEEYYMAQHLGNYTNSFQKYYLGQTLSLSEYGQAEGFASAYANARTFTLQPTAIYPAGPDAQLTLRFTGNAGPHQQAISLNGQPLLTVDFDQFQVRNETVTIPIGQVNGTMDIRFQGMLANSDLQRVSNIILQYPRQFDFENSGSYAFEIAASTDVKYLEISNFEASGGQPVLYDLTNRQRMVGVVEGGVVKFALAASAISRQLFLVNEASGVISTNLQPAPFLDFSALDHDYIILTGRQLLGSGTNEVEAYADYRASQAGGAYNPIVVEAEQLYDQFAWGIERHPFSIRNFAVFVKKNWSNPRYFFIIGKGREYPGVRTSDNLATALSAGFSVPAFGYPATDNLFLAGADGFTPVIPIGRIPATTQAQVRIYLDKVRELEANKNLPQTIADRAWMKRVMHMGGGISPFEQNEIKGHLKNMENRIAQPKFGAEVRSFFKTSTDPIQVSQAEELYDYINSGTSMITFIGHSTPGTFDLNIDNPDNFENKGRYPFIMSLGCYSGNIHLATPSIGERFCFMQDKGAIAFGASSGLGFIFSLYTFGDEFYKNIGDELYGQGIGDAIQDAIASLPSGQFGLDLLRQQFILCGDPAIRLNPAPGPDFVVDAASVKFSPAQITTQMTDFNLSFEVANIGSAVNDSITISIVHELPNGTQVAAQEMLVPAPAGRSNFTVNLPTLGSLAKGINRFYIRVDKTDRVAELPLPVAEQNNDLVMANSPGISIFFSDNSIVTAYPPEFAIVSKDDLIMAASTVDPLIQERAYVFQLDTTELFNSPLLMTHKRAEAGGVVKWQPNNNWQNGQVYYWRVSPDSLSPQQGYIWDNSSFVYLNGTDGGWNQSHFYQWKKDDFNDMELKTHGNLKFIDDFKDVSIKNAVNSVEGILMLFNSSFAGRFWYNTDAGMYAIVFDSTTAKEWLNTPPSPYGVPLNVGSPVAAFTFDTKTQAGRQQLIEFLRDVVPNKNYVLLHSTQANLSSDYRPQDWESDQAALGTDLFQILEAEGATLIRNTLNTGAVPYIFAYQKSVGPIRELLADSLKQVLSINVPIPGYWDQGSVVSTTIGPAMAWNKLDWALEPASQPQTDTVSVDLLAHNPAVQTDSLLATNIQPGEFDLSGFSAAAFPYLKLRFNARDSILRTSPQLKYWRVLYEGVPDFAVNPSVDYLLHSEQINQGEQLLFRCFVENLSDYPGDSLLVKYAVRAEDNSEVVVLKREDKMAAQDTLRTRLTLDTKTLSGSYSFLMELNPVDDQPEQNRQNNILSTRFNVVKDLRNPLLNVTFDGLQIMDGDLVSAKPLIRIALTDENPNLLLTDTGLFKLFIAIPDTTQPLQRIYFNDPNLVFYPAQGAGKNKASIEYNPIFTTDGRYQLIVQARDVAGNQSGGFDYKISFNIVNQSSISHFLNYPNPFTTSTRFIYTLTGAEPPARFKMQIMTIAGRVVRELTEDDLGPLRIGQHQTERAWDGTDEFGDPLAKGVYLYRITVQDEQGKSWKGYSTGADSYFEKGIGKMVILR
jgi:hypothetical protein